MSICCIGHQCFALGRISPRSCIDTRAALFKGCRLGVSQNNGAIWGDIHQFTWDINNFNQQQSSFDQVNMIY